MSERIRLFSGPGEVWTGDAQEFEHRVGLALDDVIEKGAELGFSFRDMEYVINAWVAAKISMLAMSAQLKNRKLHRGHDVVQDFDDEASGDEIVVTVDEEG